MLAIERKHKILDLVLHDRKVEVGDLSRRFGVTEETVRRDLNRLERDGLLRRTHGGAVARSDEPEDQPYRTRHLVNSDAKRAIAAKAAALVPNGASVMMDSSSTVHEAVAALNGHRELTLITNSVRIVSTPDATTHTIMSVGGELRRRSMTFVGPLAARAVEQFNADIALLSCNALSPAGGIMETNVADAEIKRAFLRRARRICLLADASKFDRTALISVCGFDAIHTVVTERRPANGWIEYLERFGVEIVC